MEGQVYPTYKVAALADELSLEGIDTDVFLAGTGIAPAALRSPAARISRRQLLVAYRNAVRLSTNPALGLAVGKRLRLSAYGMYGYALVSSANLREALAFSIRYHELATPTVTMSLALDDDDGTAIFTMTDAIGEASLTRFNIELQFSLVLSLTRDMAGDDFCFEEIRSAYPAPAHRAVYEELFACPIRFDADANELRFNEWWLSAPLVRANPITAQMLTETCNQLLLEMRTAEGVAKQVYAILSEDLRHASEIDSAARRLGTSARTLRRRLAEEGTSFQDLLREVRTHLATAYLRDTTMTVDDIADRLGFSDAANFRQAFKRWTGRLPSSYRTRRAR